MSSAYYRIQRKLYGKETLKKPIGLSLVKLRSIQKSYGLGNIIDLAFDTCMLRVRNENVCERERERGRNRYPTMFLYNKFPVRIFI